MLCVPSRSSVILFHRAVRLFFSCHCRNSFFYLVLCMGGLAKVKNFYSLHTRYFIRLPPIFSIDTINGRRTALLAFRCSGRNTKLFFRSFFCVVYLLYRLLLQTQNQSTFGSIVIYFSFIPNATFLLVWVSLFQVFSHPTFKFIFLCRTHLNAKLKKKIKRVTRNSGNYLFATVSLASTRYYLSMQRRGYFPAWLRHIDYASSCMYYVPLCVWLGMHNIFRVKEKRRID